MRFLTMNGGMNFCYLLEKKSFRKDQWKIKIYSWIGSLTMSNIQSL